jgi:hypothetical protein
MQIKREDSHSIEIENFEEKTEVIQLEVGVVHEIIRAWLAVTRLNEVTAVYGKGFIISKK